MESLQQVYAKFQEYREIVKDKIDQLKRRYQVETIKELVDKGLLGMSYIAKAAIIFGPLIKFASRQRSRADPGYVKEQTKPIELIREQTNARPLFASASGFYPNAMGYPFVQPPGSLPINASAYPPMAWAGQPPQPYPMVVQMLPR